MVASTPDLPPLIGQSRPFLELMEQASRAAAGTDHQEPHQSSTDVLDRLVTRKSHAAQSPPSSRIAAAAISI